MRLGTPLLLVSVVIAGHTAMATMPPTYSGFTIATTATEIKTLVEATGSGTTAIFLPPGDHTPRHGAPLGI